MGRPPKDIQERIRECEECLEEAFIAAKDWLKATMFSINCRERYESHSRRASSLSDEIHRDSVSYYYHPQLRPA